MSRSKNVGNQVSSNNVGNIASASVGNTEFANVVDSADATKTNPTDRALKYLVPKNIKARPGHILRQLGVVGLDTLEPVILGALATETPLLLVGAHGTAKSLLLSRLCEALHLQWRHYNASLVNYDDLIGYPLPNDNGTLTFVQTPASVWTAQAVFIDEISRARPDMLNRLFPIIHEKKVQGLELTQLRFRWAAMNPPADTDEISADSYLGSEPLDPALADRFGFVIEIPSWSALSDADQSAVITSEPHALTHETAASISDAVELIKQEISLVKESVGAVLVNYTREILQHASRLGIWLSGRRATMLFQNMLAVHAARCVQKPSAQLCDSAWLALINSLPQRAQGVKIDGARLMVAHNQIWKTLMLDSADPRRILACERDPVRRVLRAVAFTQLTLQELSSYAADALAHLPSGGRHALAVHLMESGASARMIAAVAAQTASLFTLVCTKQNLKQFVTAGSANHRAWQAIVKHLANIASDNPEEPLICNLLAGLFSANEIKTEDDVLAVLDSWRGVRALCVGGFDSGVNVATVLAGAA